MKRKTMDGLRETRLWLTQIVKPIGQLFFGAGMLAKEFSIGEKVERFARDREMKRNGFTVYNRTEPKKEFIQNKESLELLDAAARLKHLEHLGSRVNGR